MTPRPIIEKIISKMERNVRPSTDDRKIIVMYLTDYMRLWSKEQKTKRQERKERAIAP